MPEELDEIFVELREIKDSKYVHYKLSSDNYTYEFDTPIGSDIDMKIQEDFKIRIKPDWEELAEEIQTYMKENNIVFTKEMSNEILKETRRILKEV